MNGLNDSFDNGRHLDSMVNLNLFIYKVQFIALFI